jgi:hypothetical protein
MRPGDLPCKLYGRASETSWLASDKVTLLWLGSFSLSQRRARGEAIRPRDHASANSISETSPSSSRASNFNLGTCVKPGAYKERPTIPQEPHGHRLRLTVGAHRREPRDRLLPQPHLGPPPASVVVSSTNRSSRPRESPRACYELSCGWGAGMRVYRRTGGPARATSPMRGGSSSPPPSRWSASTPFSAATTCLPEVFDAPR